MKWELVIIGFVLISFGSCSSSGENSEVVKVENTDSTSYYDSVFTPLKNSIDTFFREKNKRVEFNGTILFADHGRIIHKGSYGLISPDGKDSLSIHHRFQLASLSKPFTATAILLLEEQGLLKLSDTLGKFFPGFPFKEITIEMLLTHRSGLGNYNYFVEEFWPNKNIPIPNDSVIAIMNRHVPKTYYQPNIQFDYSNTGYMLLASIVERVTKKEFSQFMKEAIFTPLQMKNTYVYSMCSPFDDSLRLNGYDWKDRMISDFYQNGVVGDKGIFSTVEDLFLFDQAIYSGLILKPETWQKAFQGSIPESEEPGANNYGYGWRLKTSFNGYEVVYHSGWWKGFRSYLIRNITLKQTVIVLDNMKRNSFISVEELLDLCDGGEFTSEIARDTLYKSE